MKRVLVADDQANCRELMRTILERAGHLVFEAADGQRAVRSARTWLPDLIIMDLRMPLLDGFGALAELRSDGKFADTPIVALSGNGMEGDHERALSAGFTAWMPKPIGMTALRAGVGRWLG